MSLTLDDLERFGPIAAFGIAVWRGSAVVTRLQSAIDALTDELKRHTEWRDRTDLRLASVEEAVAVEVAVDDVEKRRIEERIDSVRGRRPVRATEHQVIDQDALAARKSRKK